MSRFNRHPNTEYRGFISIIQEYAEADQSSGEGVRRTIADALDAMDIEGNISADTKYLFYNTTVIKC